ncbi:MAG: hypothetical protein RLZZ15_2336 [Verrucomicrobiota bacterium]|jgi:ribosomal protein L3 glutamine methyltransferase
MSRRNADPFAAAAALATVGDWLRFAEKLYATHGLALGQVATDAHDEALYLVLHALALPLDSDARALTQKLTAAEKARLEKLFRRRVLDRVPAAYLTREAWLGEHRFYVDERVIIPRSYFLEIIPTLRCRAGSPTPPSRRTRNENGALGNGRASLGRGGVGDPALQQSAAQLPAPAAEFLRLADVCTGSGCLAILLAHEFPAAHVDAIDLSPAALEVAALNVRAHHLGRRVKLFASDVFAAVPPARYDLILSNPPYEPSKHVDSQAPEFAAEPRLAHDGGRDGLAIIRKLLRESRDRLTPHGLVVIEVGGLRAAMDREFAALAPEWLPTQDGADCVCLIHAARLAAWRG